MYEKNKEVKNIRKINSKVSTQDVFVETSFVNGVKPRPALFGFDKKYNYIKSNSWII